MNCVSYHIMFEDTVTVAISKVQIIDIVVGKHRRLQISLTLHIPVILGHSNIKNQI